MAMLDMMPSSWCCVYSTADSRLVQRISRRPYSVHQSKISSTITGLYGTLLYSTGNAGSSLAMHLPCSYQLDDSFERYNHNGVRLRPPTVRSARSTMFDRQAFEEPATHLSRAADRHVSYWLTYTEGFQDIT
ncbi:unnamed protein product [Fusarium venenatum]|uniref:Uncharacterized protein n=1 Tax=Fusarium venenatum TaxID=56646 RepID=A0A2L2T303_9HYPO|nr:LOW QUALITY PROTEIN: uncharacterized protein FVRRES_00600 [Fusarium venenatum]CEI64088.1 unnamed protein product [Fusarium venenatum]